MLYLQPARNSALLNQILSSSAETDDEKKGLRRQHEAMVAWAKGNVQPALEEADLFIDQKGNFTGNKDLIGEGDVSHCFCWGLRWSTLSVMWSTTLKIMGMDVECHVGPR